MIARKFWHEVERLRNGFDRAVVVHQHAPLADEKALSPHHLEVEHRLDLTASDGFDFGDSQLIAVKHQG
jgi:hypothetical protein